MMNVCISDIIQCQGLRRRKLRPRLQPVKHEEEQVAEMEQEEEDSPGIGPRLRTRQRALGARMEADYEVRGQRPGRLRPGRRRPTGGRRPGRPGRPRRLRGRRPLPVTQTDVSSSLYVHCVLSRCMSTMTTITMTTMMTTTTTMTTPPGLGLGAGLGQERGQELDQGSQQDQDQGSPQGLDLGQVLEQVYPYLIHQIPKTSSKSFGRSSSR